MKIKRISKEKVKAWVAWTCQQIDFIERYRASKSRWNKPLYLMNNRIELNDKGYLAIDTSRPRVYDEDDNEMFIDRKLREDVEVMTPYEREVVARLKKMPKRGKRIVFGKGKYSW